MKTAAALQDEFKGIFAPETIERYIGESLDMLGESRINVFVPVLAHRFARERLKALGQAEGKITKLVPEVLFVCTHNAGRSQMAAGLLNKHAQGRVHIRSAGSDPADRDQPGRGRGDERARDRHVGGVSQAADRRGRPAADVVITMGCGDACPIYPGKRYLDWELEDPAGKSLDECARSGTSSIGG